MGMTGTKRLGQSDGERARPQVLRLPFFESDSAIVAALKGGQAAGGAALYDRHHGHVRRVLIRLLGPGAHLGDLVQDVFVAFLRSAETMRDASALRGFLIGVAVRLVALELRRRKIRRWISLSPSGALPETPVAPRDVEGREALAALYRLLGRMPNRRRLAFVLRVVQGCEILEVASALGVSDSTAKREVVRAQEQLLRQASREPALLQYIEQRLEAADTGERDE